MCVKFWSKITIEKTLEILDFGERHNPHRLPAHLGKKAEFCVVTLHWKRISHHLPANTQCTVSRNHCEKCTMCKRTLLQSQKPLHISMAGTQALPPADSASNTLKSPTVILTLSGTRGLSVL